MGYTHYWRLSNISQHSSRWEAAAADMAVIVNLSPVPLADGYGKGKPVLEKTKVTFNGLEANDQGHETFMFPGTPGFDFCKTAAKPYDVVVCACLAVAKDIFGTEIEVSSDGDANDWAEGVALANRVLGRPIANPITD